MYPIQEISEGARESPEQVGTKEKFWYDNHKQMFKLGRSATGEYWAEKITSELCALLGLPHASYDFATWNGHLGTTTVNFVPRPGRLVLGNELLASFVPGYDGTKRYRARQHTVGRVIAALSLPIGLGAGPLQRIRPPIGVPPNFLISDPKDFFAGYILLDAWIGNTDRHHENWGLVVVPDGVHLAPTFDHASSLGRELSDAQRLERLATKDVRRALPYYVARAKSGFYRSENEDHALSTLEAYEAIAERAPDGADYWSGRLCSVTADRIDAILSEVPDGIMSMAAKQFARSLLMENQRRICSNG